MAIYGQTVLVIDDRGNRTDDFLSAGTVARIRVKPVLDNDRIAKYRDLLWLGMQEAGLSLRDIEAVCHAAARKRSQINERLRAIRFEARQRDDG